MAAQLSRLQSSNGVDCYLSRAQGLSVAQRWPREWEEPAEPTLPPGEQGYERVCPPLGQPCQHPLPTPPLHVLTERALLASPIEMPRLKATLIWPPM